MPSSYPTTCSSQASKAISPHAGHRGQALPLLHEANPGEHVAQNKEADMIQADATFCQSAAAMAVTYWVLTKSTRVPSPLLECSQSSVQSCDAPHINRVTVWLKGKGSRPMGRRCEGGREGVHWELPQMLTFLGYAGAGLRSQED